MAVSIVVFVQIQKNTYYDGLAVIYGSCALYSRLCGGITKELKRWYCFERYTWNWMCQHTGKTWKLQVLHESDHSTYQPTSVLLEIFYSLCGLDLHESFDWTSTALDRIGSPQMSHLRAYPQAVTYMYIVIWWLTDHYNKTHIPYDCTLQTKHRTNCKQCIAFGEKLIICSTKIGTAAKAERSSFSVETDHSVTNVFRP